THNAIPSIGNCKSGHTRSARSPGNGRKINLFPVIADSSYDVEGEGERPAAVFEGNGGSRTMTHRVQECLQLRMQGLFWSNRRLGNFNLRVHRRSAGGLCVSCDGEDQHFLASVVERHVLAGLEKTYLAHALGRNAASSEVGHAAGFELQPDVGNIHLAGENRQPDGADFFYRRIGERQHDVKVVDHEIEHHIHVERTWREHAEPVHLKKHGLRQQRNGGTDSRIEALQVPDLSNSFVVRGELDQFVGLGEGRSQWFLDQNVYARCHERAGDRKMVCGGRRYRCRPDFAVRTEHLFQGPEGAAAELAGHGIGAVQIRIYNPHQAYRFTLLLEFSVNASMISSEDAHSHHGDRDPILGWQAGFSRGWLPATNCNRKAGKEHLEHCRDVSSSILFEGRLSDPCGQSPCLPFQIFS